MQQLPLNKAYTLEMVQDFIQSMVTKELLTQEQADAVDANDVADFLDSDIAQGIRTARTVYREMPFSLGVSAKEIYDHWEQEDETILVQGIIDCLYETEEGLVLLDFKTDNISDRFQGDFERAFLIDRYRIQLELYAKAIERIVKQPVQHRYLYFLDGGHAVEI
jgi:ATP-dependent helicase/nuclease subunit A